MSTARAWNDAPPAGAARLGNVEVLALWAFSRVMVQFLMGAYGSDIPLYRDVAGLIAAGGNPYATLPLDHAPLVPLLLVLPHALSFGSYAIAFRVFMTVVDLACLLQVGRICDVAAASRAERVRAQLAYTGLGLLVFPFLFERFDLVIALVLLVAVECAARGRNVLGAVVLALGGGLHVALVPLLAPWALAAWRRSRRAGLAAAGAGAAALAGIAAFAALRFGPPALRALDYHALRGTEIESVPASLVLAGAAAGAPVQLDGSSGALLLSSALEPAIVVVVAALVLGVVAAAWLAARPAPAVAETPGERASAAAQGLLFHLLAFLVATRILLPQYLVWLVPLAAIEGARAARPPWRSWATALFATTAVFPLGIQALVRLEPWCVATLFLRNALLVTLFVRAGRAWIERARTASPPPGAALRLPRFAAVGASGVLVNQGLLMLLHGVAGAPLWLASPIAIEASILSNFTLHTQWTWRDQPVDSGRAWWARCLRYHAAAALALAANYGVLLALVSAAHVDYRLANLAGIALGSIANYLASDRWVFRRPAT